MVSYFIVSSIEFVNLHYKPIYNSNLIIMAKTEKSRYHYFYILNIKLRKKNSTKDLPTSDYVRLFKDLYRNKIHKESSSSKHCIIRFLFEEKSNQKIDYLYGS